MLLPANISLHVWVCLGALGLTTHAPCASACAPPIPLDRPLARITPLAFLFLQLADGRSWDYSASIIEGANSYNKSPLKQRDRQTYLTYWFCFSGEPWLIHVFIHHYPVHIQGLVNDDLIYPDQYYSLFTISPCPHIAQKRAKNGRSINKKQFKASTLFEFSIRFWNVSPKGWMTGKKREFIKTTKSCNNYSSTWDTY